MQTPTRALFAFAFVAALASPLTGCAGLIHQSAAQAEASAPVSLSAEETVILTETNALRAANGLVPLKADAKLVAIARARSRDMAKRNYFDHLTPEGRSVFMIMRDNKVAFGAAGENIARNLETAARAPQQIMADWSKTPAQRVNLLHDAYDRVGIGAVRSSDGQVYVTQILAD